MCFVVLHLIQIMSELIDRLRRMGDYSVKWMKNIHKFAK